MWTSVRVVVEFGKQASVTYYPGRMKYGEGWRLGGGSPLRSGGCVMGFRLDQRHLLLSNRERWDCGVWRMWTSEWMVKFVGLGECDILSGADEVRRRVEAWGR